MEKEVIASVKGKGRLGLTVQRVTPQIAESLGLDSTDGVVITSVEQGSPGDEAGLRRGDVIIEVDRKPIRDVKGLKDATAKIRDGKSVLFLVQRGETTLFLAMKSR
jgi:serine protease Do